MHKILEIEGQVFPVKSGSAISGVDDRLVRYDAISYFFSVSITLQSMDGFIDGD